MREKFCTAVVLAAGQGKRMGGRVAKQYLEIQERPLLYYTLRAFESSSLIDSILLMVGDETQISYCKKEIIDEYHFSKVDKIAIGGKERYDSVFQALCAIEEFYPAEAKDGYVFIHDAARPLVTQDILERCFLAAQKDGACTAAMPVKDTIKLADENGFAASTPPRSMLWTVQTPQVFSFPLIYSAHCKMQDSREKLAEKGIAVTDDAMVVETFTEAKVKLVKGSYENIKVTTPDDLCVAEAFLRAAERPAR